MAFRIEHQPARDLLIARGFGDGDLAEGLQVVEAIRQSWNRTPTANLMLDVSGLDMIPTRDEAQVIVEAYASLLGGRTCRLAFVARPGAQFGMTRMIEILSELRGVTVASFQSGDEALEWLDAAGDPGA